MAQSLSNILIHVVFSTKGRTPFLQKKTDRDAMIGHLVGALKDNKCPSIITNVMEDHAHILCSLHRTVATSDLLAKIKAISSKQIKDHQGVLDFQWQNGYAVFSVSQSKRKQVKEYIRNQEEHHKRRSFQDELREFLTKHEVSWDEEEIWD